MRPRNEVLLAFIKLPVGEREIESLASRTGIWGTLELAPIGSRGLPRPGSGVQVSLLIPSGPCTRARLLLHQRDCFILASPCQEVGIPRCGPERCWANLSPTKVCLGVFDFLVVSG
ncbi:hypothetical protein KIL84_018141 [Mauremys mutica]|uniref:Uncharacterized protein n=1 Tax=Mauremys mutica TaxID=74926 RepID=A0A9D3XSR5_9SAUR|nr:hypothetical protein KIL84_018141 [Mauremys mutica]